MRSLFFIVALIGLFAPYQGIGAVSPTADDPSKRKLGRGLKDAPVVISGSTMTVNGLPIAGATIVLMDQSGIVRRASTGHFGRFAFRNVLPGSTYVMYVYHGRFAFAVPTVVIEVNESRDDLHFVGEFPE